MIKRMGNRWLVMCMVLAISTQLQAQQKVEKKMPSEHRNAEKDWEEIGQNFKNAFQKLGKRMEVDIQTAANRLEETLGDPDLWEGVGQDVARAGREVADAATYVSRDESDCNVDSRYDEEKTKKFSKNFRLSAGQQMAIENKFGKVHINTWDKAEATVDVVMVARSSNESRAQQLLDRISILVDENGSNEILVKTQMESMNIGGGNKQSFEINYTVNMPRNNPLRIKNSFGDTYVADLSGKADLQCAYGSLKTERLNNSDNYLKVSFGEGRIGYCKSGEVKVSYSNLDITEGMNLTIESSFSDLKVRNLQTAKVKAKYGSVDLGTNGKGFRSFDVEGSFSDIDLRMPSSMGFDFDIKVSYADLDWDDSEVHYKTVEKSNTSKTVTGSFGKSSSGNIRVISRYGDVDFKVRE